MSFFIKFPETVLKNYTYYVLNFLDVFFCDYGGHIIVTDFITNS